MRGEEEEEQHKVVVANMTWRVKQQTKKKTNIDAIKWSKMKSKEKELREGLVSRVN